MLLLVLIEVVVEESECSQKAEDNAWCPVEATLALELFVFFTSFGSLLTRLPVASRGFRVGISSSHGDGSCVM
jgi:hypothetical protein